jgi:hypothetical protein
VNAFVRQPANERTASLAEDEKNQRLGRYVVNSYGKESVGAFVPPPLPPIPPVRLDGLQQVLEQANQALGRLDGLASILPDLSLHLHLRPQRGRAVFPNRRNAVVVVGPTDV